ncbi:MAG: PIG-L family deacetylase, partial [Chitinophagaceae bacterium]
PAFSINLSPGVLVFKKSQNNVMHASAKITAFTDLSTRYFNVFLPHNNAFDNKQLGPLKLKQNAIYTIDIPLSRKVKEVNGEILQTSGGENGKDIIPASVEIGTGTDPRTDVYGNNKDMATISYDHIPVIRYFYQDSITILHLDVKTTGKKAGYIKGAGDKVPEAMEQLGYQITYLQENDINAEFLKQFDVIVTGIRAYNMHEWLPSRYDVLMDYVKNGGNLVVQYNTNSFVGPMKTAKIGPYDMTILNSRITDEDAPMNIIDPKHPLLNEPNKISAKDFEGWIQERGIYFADKFAPEYKPVFALRDPGETEDRVGSLLMAKYGKGRFIYTGLVFFRELPAGVPGAYRLFANLLSNPNSK